MNEENKTNEGNNIDSLRGVLFDTLRGIVDGSVEIDKANAINATAKRIIETGRLEIDHMKAAQIVSPSSFLASNAMQITATGTQTTEQVGGVTKTSHRLRGRG